MTLVIYSFSYRDHREKLSMRAINHQGDRINEDFKEEVNKPLYSQAQKRDADKLHLEITIFLEGSDHLMSVVSIPQ
jgi:hypothetical protein